MTRLAVLSDWHVGQAARALDLCPSSMATGSKANPSEKSYLEEFLRLVAKNHITADYMVLPGDLTNRAHPEEFLLASSVVFEIADALSVHHEHILFVPGNHDVDWLPAVHYKPDSTGFSRTQRYASLRFPEWQFENLLKLPTPHLCESPYYCLWNLPDILAIGINSSSHDNPDESVHHGLIPEVTIDALDSLLKALPGEPTALRILVAHHHPISHRDPIPNEPDFSEMTNSARLLDLLFQHSFDLIIHGHKHCPHFRVIGDESMRPIVLLGAGSFSATLDTRWAGRVQNQFHIVETLGRDSRGLVRGHIYSWCYSVGEGWIQSFPRAGIRHKLSFGSYVYPKELRERLASEITQHFSKSPVMTWDDLLQAFPDIEFIHFAKVMDALNALKDDLMFLLRGEIPDLVLVKQKG